MEDTNSVASLMDSTSSKIQQLQKAFAELEGQRAVTLNMKWKELEEHFHGLERSLKRRFHELEDQEKEYETKTRLHKFVSDNRKNLASLKEEIPLAFKAASNPASLVLDSLEGEIGVLLDSGRQIDAVNLAFAFELTQQFPPVESYLTEAKRSPDNASATLDEFKERELTSVKAVVKCIEEHNLEEQYSVEPLQKRIHELEKVKAEKKKATEPTKPQTKRPRGAQPLVTDNNNNNNNNKTGYGRVIPESYPQYVYDNRPFLTGPIMAAQAPPPQTYTFSPVATHGNFYGNCYQYQAPPPPYFH
ncbi:unnamed protein product [Eruca vesicaria subsp. sativa]|uniref:FRIGIDA-like protein n=1 Tax=Eruca vesicaria subsp. sativa TaxID=29727 RepID=A0ABC8K5C5_ERUVS|nr:unnamed protein product [Eruca vesicaria subsp. sativa]